MKYRNMKLFFLLFSIFILINITGCGKKESDDAETSLRGVEVSAGSPILTKMTEYLNLNASTMFLSQEIVRATFSGYIIKTGKNLGDHVNKGELLFSIKTKEASAADSIDLGAQFSGVVNVYARTNGVLSELSYQTGDYITESDRLALIVDPSSLRIMLNVPFQYSRNVNVADIFPIKLPDNKEFYARVIKKIPSIDAANQTQSFVLEPRAPINIPANLNIIVRVPLQSVADAVALPKSAVVTNETESEFWVMKIINDTTAVKLEIKKGIETDSLIQIKFPVLIMSDRFITEGAYGLQDTVKVLIKK